MKTFYIVRHGQTRFNILGKIQGACDSPLTEVGIAQAKIVGKYIKEQGIEIDTFYCSTAERASDTLECITNQPYTRIKGISEWQFGIYEGEHEYLNPKPPYGDFFIAYGGEGQNQVAERVNQSLLDIAKNDPLTTSLCVTHGGALFAFLTKWAAYSRIDLPNKVSNGAILQYSYFDGNFILEAVHDPVGLMERR